MRVAGVVAAAIAVGLAGEFAKLGQVEIEPRVLAIEADVVGERRGGEFDLAEDAAGEFAEAVAGRAGRHREEPRPVCPLQDISSGVASSTPRR
jgi:Mrp family chromosome partitioning ATPase